MTCLWFVHDFLIHVHYLFMTCSQLAYGLFITCSWLVHDLFMLLFITCALLGLRLSGYFFVFRLFFLRHNENDRVIPISDLLLGTINNGSQPNILSWEPLVMAPNPIFLVGSHYSWCPRPEKILELACHFHYVSKKSNRNIKNYPEEFICNSTLLTASSARDIHSTITMLVSSVYFQSPQSKGG